MSHSHLGALAVVAVLSGLPAAAPAAEAEKCSGTVSGDVKASFECTATLVRQGDAGLVFAVHAAAPIEGIPSLVPGAFLVPGRPAARTYTLDDLGMGKAAVAVENGLLYTAAKTSSRRGEVTLTIRSFRKSAKVPGTYDVHGTYRARLVPVGGGTKGEVVVDVRF